MKKLMAGLTFLRIIVGWHFLYEGIAKLMTPGWTAKSYLLGSSWIFADIFQQMATSPVVMNVVNFLNIWGLILIGFLLLVGALIRLSSIAGAVLLFFYFVAYPPIPGYTFGAITEGSYLLVDKILIEFFILLLFALVPADLFYGVDRLFKRWKEEKAHFPVPETKEEPSLARREMLKDLISVPFLGAFAYAVYKKRRWDSFEEKFLLKKPDAITGATVRSFVFSALDDLKDKVPKGKIGDLDLSRLIMGGNLIGGWAHARDLIYASKLVKAYHTDERVMMTLQLAEKCGVNAISTNPALIRIMHKYWRETRGEIKFISDCGGGGVKREGLMGSIRKSEEAGASAMYIIGNVADRLVQSGDFDTIAAALELIRSYGKPAGIGAHLLQTVQECVARGLKPDFWMKTLHHHNYWSAQVDPERKIGTDLEKAYKHWADPSYDYKRKFSACNMYCNHPEETIAFMNDLPEPWVAFKVLSAGAISPKSGFKYAFNGGADFICVGMYDFQVVEDCNITLETLANVKRIRPWCG